MHPIVVFLLDGLADRAHESLGGRSGLEAATTPNLDRLCSAGSCGVLYAIGPGRAPSSEVAHWSMFGYRSDEFPGRAVVEACDGITIVGLTFSLAHVWRGEAVLRIVGGADERVTDSDAFFRDRHPVLRPQAVVPEAERTARVAEEWTREVMRRLDGERFNVITL